MQELRCLAPHPARHKWPNKRGLPHDYRLPVTLPFQVEFTGTFYGDLDDVPDGQFGVMCPKCKAVHAFRRTDLEPPLKAAA